MEKYITQVKFYSYYLYMRNNEFPTLQCGDHLFQQYICDMWVSTDQNCLQWIESHQVNLHATLYNGLEDAVHNTKRDIHINNLGHHIILPSSYIGGPCYINQCF
jgi:helitron helicase-like protein